MNVMMSPSQVNGIEKYLNETDVMLEYGSGGSTLHFSKYVDKYYSIEHNEEWFRNVNSNIQSNSNIIYNHVKANYSGEDVGSLIGKQNLTQKQIDTILQEYPLCEENSQYSCVGRYSQFTDYINYIDKLNVEQFDKVLIDGRARTVCAYKILPYLHKGSVVFIDDFFRLSYTGRSRGDIEFGQQIFTNYTQVERIDTMLVLRKK
tara:strand:+ start:844 stop:1455 length:612 start_codon:yes stop_codon:yes gene_type:complete